MLSANTDLPLQSLQSEQLQHILGEARRDTGKFGHPFFRWTILFALLVLCISLLPLWLSFVLPKVIAWVNAAILSAVLLLWLIIALNAVRNVLKLQKAPLVPLPALRAARERRFLHVVIVPCYLDPMEVLLECLGSLALQEHPERLMVVVTFEAKTPDLKQKIDNVKAEFDNNCFGEFVVVVHTLDQSREIAGGCSNKNFALREAHARITQRSDFHRLAVTLTTCDTDSKFHPHYFQVLETMYNCENPSLRRLAKPVVWQAPLFYNWDLDRRPFFNRVTHLMRSMMMLGGLISFNLNPMSIFSYPMELGLAAGFINPRYVLRFLLSSFHGGAGDQQVGETCVAG